jgi:hypothetical protein
MKISPFCRSTLVYAAVFLCLGAPSSAEHGFPNAEEVLTYNINWPSGLSLGEGSLRARKGAGGWEFELELSAAIPGFSVVDRYRSVSNAQLCSVEFEKDLTHGARKTREKTVFDYRAGKAIRTTTNGGTSETSIPSCARDALNFLFYSRGELAQGRVPPAQAILFGALYQVRLDYTGSQVIKVNEAPTQVDRVGVALKGPSSDIQFEIFFAREAARTPVLVRVPFSMGTFSMELVR